MWTSIVSQPSTLRLLTARPDDTDARDYVYAPGLGLLPASRDNRALVPRVLDQGREGACVGFALAAVVNVSLARRARGGRRLPPARLASAWMLYEMARRYDEWKGEEYAGTSLRGAMKGWHKHGVAAERLWKRRGREDPGTLTPEAAEDARRRPLGAYYRVVDSDVAHVQAAIVEADAVLASLWVHPGWRQDGLGPARGGPSLRRIPAGGGGPGLHAVALVGYTADGFIVQNSWGARWGTGGFALLGYEDWMENRQDAWVARPGVESRDEDGSPRIFPARFPGAPEAEGLAETSVSGLDVDPQAVPYLVNTGDRGALSTSGRLRTPPEDLPDMARLALLATARHGTRDVVLYAHGGLVSQPSAAESASRLWRACRERDLTAYFFVWESGIAESIMGWLRSGDDAAGPAGLPVADVLDDLSAATRRLLRDAQRAFGRSLGPVVREAFWDEMKGRAAGASTAAGGARRFAGTLLGTMRGDPRPEPYTLHLVAHSAGAIFVAHLYDALRGRLDARVRLGSVHLMAPAVTLAEAERLFAGGGALVPPERLRVYTLSATDEDADNIVIYPSSLLTYVADCLEDAARTPLLGIGTDLRDHAPGWATRPAVPGGHRSRRHVEFDEKGREVEVVLDAIAAGG